MKKLFVFATGNIWRRAKKNQANLIALIKNFEIDGVEITFDSRQRLYDFKLNLSQAEWLKKLKYVSIHSPFHLIQEAGGEKEVIRQLDCLENLYQKIKAKNLIIHLNNLPAPAVLRKYQFKVSAENLLPKRKINVKKITEILKRYKNIGLCLDVAHAYCWSAAETEKLVKEFSRRITQVHFSGTYRNQDHQSLRKVTPEFIKSIQPIKRLNVPIVIEEDMGKKDVKWIKGEIKYIKSLF